MDNVVFEIAKQVPALGVFAFIVVKFLQAQKQMSAHLDVMQQRCHQLQERSLNCMSDNTEILGEVKQVLTRMNGSN